MTNLYLLNETAKTYRMDEIENMSLDHALLEYERICKAMTSLQITSCLIDNIGWLREEDDSRKVVYSTAARDHFAKETGYKNRSNAKPNTCTILEDQKRLIEWNAAEKYGWDVCRQFSEINSKYRAEFNKFWNMFRDTQ